MKVKMLFTTTIICFCFLINAQEQFYNGMKIPVDSAEIFLPKYISTCDNDEMLFGICNKGNTIVFDRTPQNFTDWENDPIYTIEYCNAQWMNAKPTKFPGKPWYNNILLPNNGKRIFYAWWLPLNENGEISNINIWNVIFEHNEWKQPRKPPSPINSNYVDSWPSADNRGTLFFFSTRPSGLGSGDIYYSIPENGAYNSLIHFDNRINTKHLEHDPAISPCGKYLVFSSYREDNFGEDDLFLATLDINYSIISVSRFNAQINSSAKDNRPYFSPDGQLLFFTSDRFGSLDIFWISTKKLTLITE